jgi:chromatin structure-remodeling complex subunit RSC1/2
MTVTTAQKSAIQEIIQLIKSVTSPKKRRNLSDLFLDLVDRDAWAHYYEVRVSAYAYSPRRYVNHMG